MVSDVTIVGSSTVARDPTVVGSSGTSRARSRGTGAPCFATGMANRADGASARRLSQFV